MGFFALLLVGLFAQAQDQTLLKVRLPEGPSPIIVELLIGGKSNTMLVDTAAGFTMIEKADPALISGVGPGSTLKEATQTELRVRTFTLRTLEAQSLRLEKVVAGELDMKNARSITGANLSGVLGIPELSHGKILLDYPNGSMEVHQGPWRLSANRSRLEKLSFFFAFPTISTSILGRNTSLIVDTGYDGCITLSAWLFNALAQVGSIKVSEIARRSVVTSGAYVGRQGVFLKGESMGKKLRGVEVAEAPGEAGILGIQWLCGFTTEFDMAERELRYAEWPEAPSPVDVQGMFGAILTFEGGHAKVNRLKPGGGAAQAAGLAEGDVNGGIGSLPPGKLTNAGIIATVKENAGKAISVKYVRAADGTTRDVLLQLPKLVSPWAFPVD